MEIADPVFGESGGNKVGVKFLSRFIATLDFPAERLYLKKGRRYCEADLWDLSGLHVWRKHGTIVIHSVDKDSVAARAGLQANDSLVKCDDRDTAKMSLEEIRLRCCQTGPLFLVVVRRNEEKVVKLELKR
jgi:S1-C subfamily serine protease